MQDKDSLTNQRTGALYIRVSTDKQEELSPDAQIRLGLEYAKQHNIYIPDNFIFRDDGISGKKADRRPAFKALIAHARAKEHPIDCILVWKFSRFARNQEESIVYKSMLARDKVDVISISEPLPDGPFGSLNERIIEWMDEYYLTNLSSEVTRGMTENAMRGNYQAAPGIGYKSAGYRQPPVKDPETFPILTYIDRWFMEENLTTRQISVKLNAMGFRTKRGNLFETRTIEYIIRNPFYAGKIRWNYTERGRRLKSEEEVIIVDGKHEPAWSWEHYLEMNKKLDAIAAANTAGERKKRDISSCRHWLSGTLFCSSCGKSLAASGSKKKPGFQCWAYCKGLCTESHYISYEMAEAGVIEGLEALLSSDTIFYEIIHSSSGNQEKEKELEQTLSRLNERERRAKDAYLNEIDTLEEYKETKFRINEERAGIKKELDALYDTLHAQSKEADDKCMIERVEEVLMILKNPDIDYEKKGIALRGIIDRIIFDRKNTVFDFHLRLVK